MKLPLSILYVIILSRCASNGLDKRMEIYSKESFKKGSKAVVFLDVLEESTKNNEQVSLSYE